MVWSLYICKSLMCLVCSWTVLICSPVCKQKQLQKIENVQITTVKQINSLYIYDLWFIYDLCIAFYWAGFTVAQRERGHKEDTRGHNGHKRTSRCPTSPTHPFAYKRQPQHRDHPTLFRIVRGFFYVPQNYQHSRNCEMGPPAYCPYSRRLESMTICRWNYKGSTSSSVIERSWVLVRSESQTHDLPCHSTEHNQVSYQCAVHLL